VALVACLAGLALQRPASASAKSAKLDVTAKARLIPSDGATLVQEGPFTGAPLGHGSIHLRTRLGQGNGAVFSFVMTTSRGSVRGSGNVVLHFTDSAVDYRGTAAITSGDGAFRTLRASGIRVAGRGALTAKAYSLHLTGSVRS